MSSSQQQQQPRDGASSSSAKPISMSLGGKGNGTPTSNGASKKTGFSFQSSSGKGTTSRAPERTLARRPHHGLHGGDSDDDNDDDAAAPAHQEVTGFDTLTGTAIAADKSHEKQPLVIPVTSKNNWHDRPGVNLARPKGKKNLLPREVQALQEAQRKGLVNAGGDVETEGPSMSYGLSLAQPKAAATDEPGDGDRVMPDAEGPADGEAAEAARKPLTQDEVALQALIRESQGDAGDGRRSDLVIESTTAGGGGEARYDETTSFRADIAARPDPASLDQYNAIPVEDFGAALLRGMGWKEGQAVGRGQYGNNAKAVGAPRVPERRPGFLGIGAKDASGGKGAEAELGAWGRAAMRKGSRKAGKEGEPNTEGVYMPVMMRNTKTGEFVTEEELAALQKTKKTDDDEWRERRDRNLEKSGRDRDRDARRRRDDDYYEDRSERKSSRRDRSRSSSDRHSRRRKYDDDDDDRYYRERDSDRDRRRDRERDRDSDRDRDRSHRHRDDDRYSSRHSSSKESSRHGRDRDRDRDRGSDRDRDSYRRRRYDDR